MPVTYKSVQDDDGASVVLLEVEEGVTFLTNEDYDEIDSRLDELEENSDGTNGENGLPTVSTKDNGKILSVVDGEWAAAELPVYSGEYEISPLTSSDIEMQTAQTYMNTNVRIKKIPYAEVQNNSGGITASIGE